VTPLRQIALPGWRRVVAVDTAVLLLLRRRESDGLIRLMRALTRLGDTGSWLTLALVLAASGGPGPALAAHLSTAALLALVLSQTLKRTFRRARPTAGISGFAALVENPDAFSFPSGHTAVAFAVAAALAGQGDGLGLVLFPLAIGIGLSRLILGAHYPLDVAAGALVGLAAGPLARGLLDGSLMTQAQATRLLLGLVG
jgi:undecaprenyl-diphosphatase